MAAAFAQRGGGGLSLCLASVGVVKTLSVAAFTLEIDADHGTQSTFQAICASPDDANMFAALLQAALLYQPSRADQPNQDMTALLSHAKVAASTDRLDVTLALTNDQVVDLLQRNGLSSH